MEESEFGKGLCYNLGLFLEHRGTMINDLKAYKSIDNETRAYEMWFYGAGDHLFDFEWQSAPTKELQKRCQHFRHKILGWRLPMGNEEKGDKEKYDWAIQETKDLLRLIDKANGIKTMKGSWE